jgi:hypothetical protein
VRLNDLFLVEKIVSQPRDLKAFLASRIRMIDTVIAQAAEDYDIIKNTENGSSEYLLRYALGHANGGDRPYIPDSYYARLDRQYELRALRDNLESMMKFGARDFLKYAVNTLSYIKPVDAEPRATMALMDKVEPGFREYGYEPGSEEAENDDDYRNAKAAAAAWARTYRNILAIESMLAGLTPVLKDYQKRAAYNYRPGEYRPDHDEVETLYHATIFATEIARDGFHDEKPDERRGVGNYGNQTTISFTHDRKIAYDIVRVFREMWMIVHGQLTRRHLLSWMENEGIDHKKAASYFTRSGEPLDTPAQIIRLYRGYLGLTKLRANPMFVNMDELIPALQQRDINDIGIVACDVRLNGTEEYLHGEAEFRVDASQVVGPVKRVV